MRKNVKTTTLPQSVIQSRLGLNALGTVDIISSVGRSGHACRVARPIVLLHRRGQFHAQVSGTFRRVLMRIRKWLLIRYFTLALISP